jgi:hypothetical protein
MLVEVVKAAKFPWTPPLVQIRTPIGHTAVRWCGAPDIPSGHYHVEWTIEEQVVRGRLKLTIDGAAVLELGGDQVLLDVAGSILTAADGCWVNLYLQRENIALYPYKL